MYMYMEVDMEENPSKTQGKRLRFCTLIVVLHLAMGT